MAVMVIYQATALAPWFNEIININSETVSSLIEGLEETVQRLSSPFLSWFGNGNFFGSGELFEYFTRFVNAIALADEEGFILGILFVLGNNGEAIMEIFSGFVEGFDNKIAADIDIAPVFFVEGNST